MAAVPTSQTLLLFMHVLLPCLLLALHSQKPTTKPSLLESSGILPLIMEAALSQATIFTEMVDQELFQQK